MMYDWLSYRIRDYSLQWPEFRSFITYNAAIRDSQDKIYFLSRLTLGQFNTVI